MHLMQMAMHSSCMAYRVRWVSWATENADLALFMVHPVLLGDAFITPHATPGGCHVHGGLARYANGRRLVPWFSFPQTAYGNGYRRPPTSKGL
jgi:hypothetical protein